MPIDDVTAAAETYANEEVAKAVEPLQQQIADLEQALAECEGGNPGEPPPTSGDVPALHRVGISSSREGLSGSESHKREATKKRHDEFATQLGVTPAQMRAMSGRHVYDQNNNPVDNVNKIGVWNNCIDDGYGTVMLTTSQWQDMAGVVSGKHDATIGKFLESMSASGKRVIWNVKHEPSNNGWGGTQEEQWRNIQARIAVMVYDHDDDNIHYTDCHIPMAGDEAKWNWLAELKEQAPDNYKAVMNRTYKGLDPYPEVGVSGTGHNVQTLQKKVGDALKAWDSQGWEWAGLCFPEVAFFNWCVGHEETYNLTPAQQADRLHEQLWTWGQANKLLAYFYFDVADLDDADVRDSSRTLDSTPELLEYAKLIRGDYYE